MGRNSSCVGLLFVGLLLLTHAAEGKASRDDEETYLKSIKSSLAHINGSLTLLENSLMTTPAAPTTIATTTTTKSGLEDSVDEDCAQCVTFKEAKADVDFVYAQLVNGTIEESQVGNMTVAETNLSGITNATTPDFTAYLKKNPSLLLQFAEVTTNCTSEVTGLLKNYGGGGGITPIVVGAVVAVVLVVAVAAYVIGRKRMSG